MRAVVVISDLHLGGAAPSPGRPRGFRICSRIDVLARFVASLEELTRSSHIELVINGDFVDFLAEESPEGGFVPFIADSERAVAVLGAIVERNILVFDALRHHLLRGHTLVILAGNHDVELAYPKVQDALRGHLGRPASGLTLSLHGAPYRLDNAVIEHGHLHDGWNAIETDQVHALIDQGDESHVPPGSRLVAEIMNPTKQAWAFVDLLKPEQHRDHSFLLGLEEVDEGPGLFGRVHDLRNQPTTRRHMRLIALINEGVHLVGLDGVPSIMQMAMLDHCIV